MELNKIESYFYNETKGFEIKSLTLAETKASYLWTTECYLIETKQKTIFYVFVSDTLPINLYRIKDSESLNELYYMHVGLMTELYSDSVANNFIKDFIGNYSIFPILERRFNEIANEIELTKNSNQLSGIANQIRDCYLTLTDYLMNKVRTSNPEYKNANFTANLEEFLTIIIPGSQSETRRNIINGIAQKGWKFNSELVHKDSVNIFDLLTSFNIIQLITSTISNLLVGNNMPFNKIKCPICQSEEYTLIKNRSKELDCICNVCNTHYNVALEHIIHKI